MATTAVQSNAVGWFELYVDDLARAKTFYQAVFQRPMEDLATPPGGDMQMCMFTMSAEGTGAAGALVKSPHTKPGSGGTSASPKWALATMVLLPSCRIPRAIPSACTPCSRR